MHTLIMTGGSFDVAFAKEYLKTQTIDFTIAADRGVSYAKEIEKRPDLILGDFDSLDAETKDRMQEWDVPILTFPPEKDYTDTHLAMEEAIKRGAKKITLLGATGTRMDHAWANVGLLQMAAKKGITAQIVDSHNRITMICDEMCLTKKEAFGDYVSLIPYTNEVTGITLKGFYYPLKDATLTLGISQGISNELVEEEGNIKIKSGDLIVIESRD